MRPRLIRLLTCAAALTVCLAAWPALAGAASGVSLIRIGGLPRTFVQAPTVSFTVTAANDRSSEARPAYAAWLTGAGLTTRLRLGRPSSPLPAGRRSSVTLIATLPSAVPAARSRIVVCATNRSLKRIPKRGCVSSARFELIPAIRINTGQPTTVSPALDLSRSVSATVGAAGGTLSATAADGSTLTLSIPPGALAGDEQLTAVPLQRLDGSGFRLAAGVQIAPDGLRLLVPATLSITPARGVRLTRQVAFAYQGTGAQFGLTALAPGRAVAIPLLRLGGAGLADASDSERNARAARAPRDALAAWLQQLTPPLGQLRLARLHQHPSGVPNPAAQVKGELGGFYNRFVAPSLTHAGSSLGAFTKAAGQTIAWRREVTLLGDAKLFAGQQQRRAQDLLGPALVRVWSSRTSACAAGASVGRLRAVMVLGHVAQSLGLDSLIGGPAAIAVAVQQCSQILVPASVTVPSTAWQASSASSMLATINSTVSASGTLVLTGALGDNAFGFQSPHVALSESVISATASTALQSGSCSAPAFLSYSSDPAQMYAVFLGRLDLPDDLFDGPPPPWTFDLTLGGADMASWTITCPPSMQPTTFTQSPGAMSGLAAITGASPVRLTADLQTRSLSGSLDLLSGQSVSAFVSGHGRVFITMPK